MDFEQLKKKVIGRIGRKSYASMLRYVKEHRPVLWGLEQEGNFVEATLCYTLYMDLKRCGIVKFIGKIGTSLGFKLTPRSALHNVNKIRGTLAEWSLGHIQVGDADAWDRAAVHVRRPGPLKVC
jgi:hypothetical protein